MKTERGDIAAFLDRQAMIPYYFRNCIAGMGLAVALSLSSGAALATPGMGGMGGEPQKPKGGGCGGCGGGGDSSISRQDASRSARDAARDAMNQGESGVTIGGGGRPSEDLTGAIAQLGQTNADPAGPGPTRRSLPPQVMLSPPSPNNAPPLGSTTVSPSAIPPSRADLPPAPSDPWDFGSKSTLGIGGPVHHEPLPPTPPGESTPEQAWNAPPKPPPEPPPDYSPELQDLLQPHYDADGNLIPPSSSLASPI